MQVRPCCIIKPLRRLFPALLWWQNTITGVNPRGGEAITSGAHISGYNSSREKTGTGNDAHRSDANLGLETKYPGQSGGGGGVFPHTSVGTSNGPSAPKHGGRGGCGTIAGSGAEEKSWHDLPAVQEFTQDEVTSNLRLGRGLVSC